jgi:hypothetical protein
MTDRSKHFPINFFLFILLIISLCVNYGLYQELKVEREAHYWVSRAEYRQIKGEIERLEKIPFGVK